MAADGECSRPVYRLVDVVGREEGSGQFSPSTNLHSLRFGSPADHAQFTRLAFKPHQTRSSRSWSTSHFGAVSFSPCEFSLPPFSRLDSLLTSSRRRSSFPSRSLSFSQNSNHTQHSLLCGHACVRTPSSRSSSLSNSTSLFPSLPSSDELRSYFLRLFFDFSRWADAAHSILPRVSTLTVIYSITSPREAYRAFLHQEALRAETADRSFERRAGNSPSASGSGSQTSPGGRSSSRNLSGGGSRKGGRGLKLSFLRVAAGGKKRRKSRLADVEAGRLETEGKQIVEEGSGEVDGGSVMGLGVSLPENVGRRGGGGVGVQTTSMISVERAEDLGEERLGNSVVSEASLLFNLVRTLGTRSSRAAELFLFQSSRFCVSSSLLPPDCRRAQIQSTSLSAEPSFPSPFLQQSPPRGKRSTVETNQLGSPSSTVPPSLDSSQLHGFLPSTSDGNFVS